MAGERLILCCDTNEHVYDKRLGSLLTLRKGLSMKEVVGDYTGLGVREPFSEEASP